MSPEVLGVQERTLADQARFYFVLVKDSSGVTQACAVLAQFQTDTVRAAPHPVRAATRTLRSVFPDALRMGILFCGVPIPDGGHHLRFAPGANVAEVLDALHGAMSRLARENGARLLVIKEFDTAGADRLQALDRHGYIRGAIPPMHTLERSFKSFGDYRAALRATYRRQIDSSFARFDDAGMTAVTLSDPDEIASRFTPAVHQLYLNVHGRIENRLETFPQGFFIDLAQAMPGRVHLTLLEDRGTPRALAFGIDTPEGYSNLYVGVDYEMNQRADLYFNAFYRPMAAAFARGAKSIKLGATSDSFKTRLGSTVRPTWFYARAVSGIANKAFQTMSGVLFPTLEKPEPRRVFKSQ